MSELLRYGDGPDQVAEYFPAGPDPVARVLFLHGGYWRAAYDRTHARPLASALAEAGFAVLLAEYRRVGQPGGGYPGTLDDVATAIDTLPGGPFLLAGHSAGGHLALWAATRSGERVAGVLALAPVADLALASKLGLSNGATEEFLGGSPAEVPDRYAVADPTALPAPGVPVTILHGDADDTVPLDVARSYAADGRATLRVLEGSEHFGVITPGSADWPRVVAALNLLVKSV
ncbi:alpha/beta hydrolase family protein [Cryptosporangium sp. NPDC051539]|uniref:alpha/beta hydrolase family protein n=1 Tax=Cryptosporangium sp. NPDC051539 TaxID=3363962 RepID=UPI00379B613D